MDECVITSLAYSDHKGVLETNLGRSLRKGYEVSHTCGNGFCINPNHLVEETHAQNMGRSETHYKRHRGTKLGYILKAKYKKRFG